MSRLNIERQNKLEPKRLEYAKEKLNGLGYFITYEDNTRLEFEYKGKTIRFYGYSGWYTGSSVRDGRGITSLIEQLEPNV